MNTEKEFLYKELTGEIIEVSYNVHNSLGCGLLEKIYENSLIWEIGSLTCVYLCSSVVIK